MLYQFADLFAVRKALVLMWLFMVCSVVAGPLHAQPTAAERELGAAVRMEIAAGRLAHATLAEADRIVRDPLLGDLTHVAPLLRAALGRDSGPESEYILVRILDLLVMDEAMRPRRDVIEVSEEGLRWLSERYQSFQDPGLRYRILLITAEIDPDAARRMVQQGFARLLSQAAGGGTRLSASELQEALVICHVAERYPDASTTLGAALLAEKSRIPELVSAAKNAARSGVGR